MSSDQKSQLIGNLVIPLKTVPRRIQLLQLGHFYMADPEYGSRVAAGLGIPIDEILPTGKA
jgi:catalase